MLGVYLSEHPQEASMKIIREQVATRIVDLNLTQKQSVRLGGIITRIHPVMTKAKNEPMAFASLNDESATIDLVLFPALMPATRTSWPPTRPLSFPESLMAKPKSPQ
jgi:DNA polymerase III subunit alpha